jgi:hypothetical protein
VNAAYHNNGREAIRILLSYGYVMINRSVIEIKHAGGGANCKTREMPLDEYLHIQNLPFKASAMAMDKVANWGQMMMPYKVVEKIFINQLHIDITDSYIHDITDYVGSLAYGAKTRDNSLEKQR